MPHAHVHMSAPVQAVGADDIAIDDRAGGHLLLGRRGEARACALLHDDHGQFGHIRLLCSQSPRGECGKLRIEAVSGRGPRHECAGLGMRARAWACVRGPGSEGRGLGMRASNPEVGGSSLGHLVPLPRACMPRRSRRPRSRGRCRIDYARPHRDRRGRAADACR